MNRPTTIRTLHTKATKLARLKQARVRLWRQWRISKKTGLGDLRYQEAILRVTDAICRLLGLYPPPRVEITGPGGKPIEIEEVPAAKRGSTSGNVRGINRHKA